MKEIVALVLGSGALFSFIQYMLTRMDNKKNIEKKIDELDERSERRFKETNDKIDRNQAVLCRTHILRFADEQRSGTVHHSKEYFEQQIQDIDTYEKYCELHPDFRNGLTVMASQYIKEEYKRIYLNND
jgi:hypothetical protein